MISFRGLKLTTASLALGALALAAPASAASQARVAALPTLHVMGVVNGSNGNGNGNGDDNGNGNGNGNANASGRGGRSSTPNMYYHGGTSDGTSGKVGVEVTPKVYLVLWGSQWTNNDPSGEATILTNFLSNVGGTTWNKTVTQYCQGVASGSYTCSGGVAAGNPTGLYAGTWYDNSAAAPSHPSQNQLAAEAVNAAGHFQNTTVASNAYVQYVVATATGNSASGFGTSYCAWHSSTTSSYGDIAYTNLPYITDAGTSCGANFNKLGPNAGITIVGGHEFAETETDQFPSTGWTDGSGAEIGDKCAWNTATANASFGSYSFPVQPLWSNASNAGKGGCVLGS